MTWLNTQHLRLDHGGTLELYLIDRPSGTPTVRVVSGDGGEIIASGNATVSSISTTLNDASAAKGDTSITLTNASDVGVGDRFWIRDPDEEVRCKSKSSNTVTLWSPLLYAHSNAATVEGTRLSVAYTSEADTLFWNGYAEWIIDTDTYRYTNVVCTKYPFYRAATVTDLVDKEPHIEQLLPSETDAERLLDNALDEVIKRIAGHFEPWVYVGPQSFGTATVYAALMLVYQRQPGAVGAEMYDRYKSELAEEIDRVTSFVPRDENQDGAIDAHEKRSYKAIPLWRT